jgi:signal transduction histidine kinase
MSNSIPAVHPITRPAHEISSAAQEHGLESRAQGSLVRIVRFLSAIWFGFAAILMGLDLIFISGRPDAQLWPASYYLINAAVPLLIFGLSFLRRGMPAGSGAALAGIFLVCIVVTPLVTVALELSRPAPGPLTPTSGIVTIRTGVIYFLGLTLLAWQYRWRHVIAFNLATFFLTGVALAVTGNVVSGAIAFCIGQTLMFLALGYAMCRFSGRLRAQSAALEHANLQLRRHASTLESLTISRERNRLARELHDTLAHRLSALAVQLETAKAYLRVDVDVVQELVETALASARGGLDDTRRALQALRASPLDDLGLEMALRELVMPAAEAARLDYALIIEPLPELDPAIEQCVYRVAQEAVANATQHADATRLSVRLACADDRLTLTITDDGIGFRPDQPSIQGHFGLAGMIERAGLAGGRLTISSQRGAGATIDLELPL